MNRLEAAWRRPETVIVQDHSWTATARRADIVLPATSPLERTDIMMNRREPSLIYMSPVLEPPGKAQDDYEIFRGIAREMGFEEAFIENRDAGEWLRALWLEAEKVGEGEGLSVPEFEAFAAAGRFDVPEALEDRIALEAFVADPDGAPLATESGRSRFTMKTWRSWGSRAARGIQPDPTG